MTNKIDEQPINPNYSLAEAISDKNKDVIKSLEKAASEGKVIRIM